MIKANKSQIYNPQCIPWPILLCNLTRHTRLCIYSTCPKNFSTHTVVRNEFRFYIRHCAVNNPKQPSPGNSPLLPRVKRGVCLQVILQSEHSTLDTHSSQVAIYMCVFTYLYTYIRTHVYTYVYTYIDIIYIYIQMYTFIWPVEYRRR